MIEAPTIDYERVQSSTATIDGSRIVLTLDANGGPTSISLPVSEIPRLISAVATGAGMAKQAQSGRRTALALRARRLQALVRNHPDDSSLVIELAGGTELVFQADHQVMSKFVSACTEKTGA
jgi:hypothetical protein